MKREAWWKLNEMKSLIEEEAWLIEKFDEERIMTKAWWDEKRDDWEKLDEYKMLIVKHQKCVYCSDSNFLLKNDLSLEADNLINE